MWTLVTQDMEFYMFKLGYVRLSSKEFSLENFDKYVHLTNNAIQKHSEEYGNIEEGNQISFSQLQVYYKSKFIL